MRRNTPRSRYSVFVIAAFLFTLLASGASAQSSPARQPKGQNLTRVPAPDLSDCPPLGKKIAREKYTDEVRQDSAKIYQELLATSTLYQACHLFSGETRNACCNQVRNQSVQSCQDRVKNLEAAENPCAPKEVDCRLLRPVKCALEKMIEKKRVKCCLSIDEQVLGQLLGACVAAAAQAGSGCSVPVEHPTAKPEPVQTDAPGAQEPSAVPTASIEPTLPVDVTVLPTPLIDYATPTAVPTFISEPTHVPDLRYDEPTALPEFF